MPSDQKDMVAQNKAIEMYSRVLQIDPTDGMAWKDWAMAKLENGNYKAALMGFTKAEIYMPDKDHADYIY